MKKLHMFIATSIDGYIAGDNDDIEWLSMVDKEGEDYGYMDFISSVDTVILGRKTYDKVMTMVNDFPHKERKTYVLSKSRTGFDGNVYYVNSVQELLAEINKSDGVVFCDGGAEAIRDLLQVVRFDKIIISIIPIMLGEGVKLFSGTYPRHTMNLLHTRTYPSGLVQLWYELAGDKV